MTAETKLPRRKRLWLLAGLTAASWAVVYVAGRIAVATVSTIW